MKQKLAFLFILVANSLLLGQNNAPNINNLQATFNADNQIVTINYDLEDAENDAIRIALKSSDDGGATFQINTTNATGDIGEGIQTGTGKEITWDVTGILSTPGEHIIKVVADDAFSIDIQTIVDQIDSLQIITDMNSIVGVRHRTTGAAHLQEVKDMIETIMLENNLTVEIQEFDFNGYTAQNFIGTLQGTEDDTETIIIDGHYDTIEESPGADDNGSAVAGFLSAMRVLSNYNFKKTIKFIGFDMEESAGGQGLRGSTDYVSNHIPPHETILGVLNFEMIGYFTNEPNTQQFPADFDLLFPDAYAQVANDEFRGNFITVVADQNSDPLRMAFDAAAANYVPELKVVSFSTFLLLPDLLRSDHAPFWLTNRPALMLTDGANFRNPYYHSANDQLSTLNFTFMTNVVKATVGTAAELAEIQNSSYATTTLDIDFTGIAEQLLCDFQVLPNPATDFTFIKFNNCNFQELNAQLIDVSGKIVMEKVLNPQSEATIQLNLNSIESGIYFLVLKDGEKKRVEKIVVR